MIVDADQVLLRFVAGHLEVGRPPVTEGYLFCTDPSLPIVKIYSETMDPEEPFTPCRVRVSNNAGNPIDS
jgi:hypothetical protein